MTIPTRISDLAIDLTAYASFVALVGGIARAVSASAAGTRLAEAFGIPDPTGLATHAVEGTAQLVSTTASLLAAIAQ